MLIPILTITEFLNADSHFDLYRYLKRICIRH